MGETEGERELEVGDDFGERGWRDGVLAHGPDGEDGGEIGEAAPFFDDVVDVEIGGVDPRDSVAYGGGGWCGIRVDCGAEDADVSGGADLFGVGVAACVAFDGDGEAESGIADQESGVGVLQHGGEIGLAFAECGRNFPVMRAEDFGERLRAAGAGVEGDGARLANRNFGDEQQAANAAFGGDREIGKNGEAVDALVLDGGNDGDVGGAGAEFFGALRWDREGEIVFALQRAVREAAD